MWYNTKWAIAVTSRLTVLSVGTLFPDESACIPTVTDNALAQGLIDQSLVGISFEPTQSLEITNGEITFGGVDDSKFIGDIHFVLVSPFLSL